MYVVTMQNCNERSMEESIQCRGPFPNIKEAKEEAERWAKEEDRWEYIKASEYAGWCGNVFSDDDTYFWVIHQLEDE